MGSVPVYLEAKKEFDKVSKRKIPIRASVVAFIILFFFMITGQLILESMSVSLNAFQISKGTFTKIALMKIWDCKELLR
jgi:multiple antibiotic resistance protein